VALIVEDGSNVAGAESYVSVADATAYHAARGNAAWAALASDTIREQALRRATDYMVQVYRQRWAGDRQHDDQALDWPRTSVPDRDRGGWIALNLVPAEVVRACAEMGLRASAGDLYADQEQGVTRETVGPITVEYDITTPQAKRYSAVDALLAPYLAKGANSVTVVRS
jgi:hypothetical protein